MTEKDLTEYFENHEYIGPFKPIPHYFPDGDYISVYFEDSRCHSKKINEWLTIYYHIDYYGTEKIVGCKIKGVSLLMKKEN